MARGWRSVFDTEELAAIDATQARRDRGDTRLAWEDAHWDILTDLARDQAGLGDEGDNAYVRWAESQVDYDEPPHR